MLPDGVFVWNEFPLRSDGLIDRQSLAARNSGPEIEVQDGTTVLDSTEKALLDLWKDVLKTKRIGVNDRFFDLGGDSLAAATLQTRIEKELGKRLSLAALFNASTVAEQAHLLTGVGNGAEKMMASRVLTFRSAPKGHPLFLFHYIDSSKLLAGRFPASRTVHFIDSPFEDEFRLWEQTGKVTITMSELAKRCAEAVQSVQPAGPYNLAGYCYGGVVAFAVAQHLVAQGMPVSFVGLMDAFYQPGLKTVYWPRLRRWRFHFLKVRKLGVSYVVKKLRNRRQLARERKAAQNRPIASEKKTELTEAEKTHLRRVAFMREIVMVYRSQPYPGNVTLFRAVADPQAFRFDFGANGWDQIVQGDIKLEDFECSHLNLSEHPHVNDVAQCIESHLSSADSNSPQSP
jgi:thioesterase domain-containing protein/acyl carrier protein